jgi:hypothetical protein
MPDSMTAKQLANQKFNGITIANPYGKLLGPIELSAIGFIWGPNYGGKSTLALGMANAMADYGRIEYVPAEEHFGITLTQKIKRLKATNDNLHFRRWKGFDDLKTHLTRNGAKVVFIDSVSVINDNDDHVIAFAQWCREEDIGMWMVSHANKDGTYKGSSKFGHEADIRIEVTEDGVAQTKKNRYLGELRSIDVPMEADQIERKRKTGKAKRETRKKSTKVSDFDAQMDEVEQLMNSV